MQLHGKVRFTSTLEQLKADRRLPNREWLARVWPE
jgi:hypothetical protein